MRLQPFAFNQLLNHLGQNARWRKAHACPCKDAYSGAARPGCAACGSVGTIWDAPASGVVGLAGQKVQQSWREFGIYEEGDVVLTIPSDSPVYAIGEHDRVTLTDSSTPFSLTFVRGDGDTLRFTVDVIQRVFWLDSNDAIVDGGIPAVAANGAMTWVSGEPPAGTRHTITGRKRPEYFHFRDLLQDRAHHQGEDLPRRVVLRDFDLFSRST